MKLRLAHEGDVDNLVALVNTAYRGALAPSWASEVGLIDGPRTGRDSLLKIVRGGSSFILVATDDDTNEPLACVCLTPGANEWYLSMLATAPGSQTRGIGKLTMSQAEKYALQRGASKLTISVINHRERLIEWYAKQGFAATGHTEPFPYDDPSVGTPLRNDLALVTLTKALA